MAVETTLSISLRRRVAAWLVHLFTASGAVLGLLTLQAIHQRNFLSAFWLMGAALVVDSVDGVLARLAQTKIAASRIDGALLDNLLDYVNYVMVPAFFLLVSDLLPANWRVIGASTIVLASAYQFTQRQAKTIDHFFTGFPSYWNIVVFYLFLWQMSAWSNLVIVFILASLVFIPIKYVYPSRPDYLTRHHWLRWTILLATILWGVITLILLWIYPATHPILVALSIGYLVGYVLISLYRTFVPLRNGT
jgi:phosphatidylcholine synthase